MPNKTQKKTTKQFDFLFGHNNELQSEHNFKFHERQSFNLFVIWASTASSRFWHLSNRRDVIDLNWIDWFFNTSTTVYEFAIISEDFERKIEPFICVEFQQLAAHFKQIIKSVTDSIYSTRIRQFSLKVMQENVRKIITPRCRVEKKNHLTRIHVQFTGKLRWSFVVWCPFYTCTFQYGVVL